MTRAPKALIIAEAANPEWASVPLIGWSLAAALRGVADAHLVTQIRNRDAILRAGWIEGTDFTAIDSEAVARPMHKFSQWLRLGWTGSQAISALTYPYFEHLVWKRFGADIQAGRYDLVHRITPLSPIANSLIARRCARAGVPFVVGPLNGGVPWPNAFDRERRREREWLSYVRNAYKLLPGRGAMLKSAAAILTGSRYTQSEIPQRYQNKCVYLPENAIDPVRFNRTAVQTATLPLRACFIGRLVPYKGPDMLLEAATPLLRDGRLVLDIIGDGPMMSELQALAREREIADYVTFHGWLQHHQVQDVAAECQLLTFPSIREFGGGVVLEAMALGVVPLIVDYAGPGELVRPGTGFKVPIGSRDDIIGTFRQQLIEIAEDPAMLESVARTAQDFAMDHFTWPAKARQIAEVYDWVLARRQDKPKIMAQAHP